MEGLKAGEANRLRFERSLRLEGVEQITSFNQIPEYSFECKSMYRFEKQYLIKIVQHLLPMTAAGEGVLSWPRGKPPSECHTYNILEALLGTPNQLAQSHTPCLQRGARLVTVRSASRK